MIKGDKVLLRTVRETDLATLYALRSDVSLRGEHMRPALRSEPDFRKEFQETGYFSPDKGCLLVTDHDDHILGDIVFFAVAYMDGLELGYVLYDLASRGRGVMTEALGVTVRYLFSTRKINRLQICTSPDNEASKRLALRCGFKLEGTLRGHVFHRGRSEDSMIYSLLRDEVAVSP